MKTLFHCGLVALFALAFGFLVDAVSSGVVMIAAIAPTTLSDKGIVKQWRDMSANAFWLSLYKSVFSSSEYTGTTKSRRSIEPREDILGAPFVEYFELQNMKGDRLTDTIHIPPFDGDDEVLWGEGSDAGYVRVKGQNRVGFEIQANRKNIDFCLQSYFFSATEEDINMSEQELGGQLLPLLIDHMTDLGGRYMDADKLATFNMNYSPHVYTRIGVANEVSDGDPVVGDTNLGVPAPFEHPNTYAFINPGSLANPEFALLSANSVPNALADTPTATSWSGKVHEAVGRVDSDARPGRKMLDLIMVELKRLRIVPIRYMTENGIMSPMYIMLVSPSMMNMFLDDPDLQKRFDNAFSGHMYKHPLINEEDKIYRQLIIREAEKLDQSLYTYAYNYGDTYNYGETDEGGLDARTGLTSGDDAEGVSYTVSGSGKNTRVSLSLGSRTFRGASNATESDERQAAALDSAIGIEGGDKIDRIPILGASAIGCVPGPIYEMDRRQEDDYGRILGIGQERLGANRRIDFPTSRAHNSGYDNQGSIVVAAYNGK